MFKSLKPTTFAEAIRLLNNALIAVAGVAFCAFVAVIVTLLVRGNWGKDNYPQILTNLGWISYALLALVGMTIVAMLMNAGIDRLKVHADTSGVNVEADGHGVSPDSDPQQQQYAPPPTQPPVPTNGGEGPHVGP